MLALLGHTTDFARTCEMAGRYQKTQRIPLLTTHTDDYLTIGVDSSIPTAAVLAKKFLLGETSMEKAAAAVTRTKRSVAQVYEDVCVLRQAEPNRFYVADLRPHVGQLAIGDDISALTDVLLSVGMFSVVSISRLQSGQIWIFRHGSEWVIRCLPDVLNLNHRPKKQ